MEKKSDNLFYKNATFYALEEIIKKLNKNRFSDPEIKQTLFVHPDKLNELDIIKEGYGQGAFVAINMQKEV